MFFQKPDMLLKKSLIVRSKDFKLKKGKLAFREKISILIFFNKTFLKCLYAGKNKQDKIVLFDFDLAPKLRIGFFNYFNKETVSEENLMGSKLYSFSAFIPAIGYYIIINTSILIWLFVKEKYSTVFIPTALRTLLQIHSLPKATESIFFIFISPDSYWPGLFYTKITGGKASCVASNSPLFTFIRYSFMPTQSLILCANYQTEEYEAYKNNRWIICDSVLFWGLEEEHLIEKKSDGIQFDLAIFSSAEWMRNENMIRIKNPAFLKTNPQVNTKQYAFFYNCLKAIEDIYIKNPKLKIIFCLHPAEIRLIKENGIYPPYWDLINSLGFSTNINETDSLKIYRKIKLGISTMSTSSFDLWHLGVKALVFSGRGFEHIYLHAGYYEYLSEHKKYCFHTHEELKEMINSIIS